VSEPPGAGAWAQVISGPRLSVSLFGGVSLRLGGREIAVPNRKAKALLGYLALTPNLSEARERLVGVLWSESDEGRARGNLRQALRGLREAFARGGFGGFLTDRNEVALEPGSIIVDVTAVLDSVTAGRPHDLLLDRERLTDTLMAGYEDIDPSFRIWLLAKRQFFHERIAHSLQGVLRNGQALSSGTHESAARALLNLDPTHEEAARALISVRADNGDIGGALGIYRTLWELLDKEYDTEPSQPTQDLIARIKLAEPPQGTRAITAPGARDLMAPQPPPAPARPAAEPKLVVSVTEFDAAATREEQRYLVHGFRQELIACLVRFREWLVCNPMTALGSPLGLHDNAADFVIEASAFQVAEGVRLVLMLREVATNAYLWSERFQISMENWFDAQQSIVRRLATALNVYLSAGRLATSAQRPARDLNSYDLWLRGQATILNFDPDHWHKAEDIFRDVIACTPDFAPAYSSLAQLHNVVHIVLPGVHRDAQRTAQALEYAREAARLDPIDSRSQLSLAWSYAMSNQHEQAEVHLRLAHELNENDPWTLMSAAMCFAFCGATERARELAADALRLPLTPSPLQWAYHTAIRFLGGDYEGCVQAARLAGESMPTSPGYMVSALFHLGQTDAASVELQRFLGVIRGRWVGQEPASDANIARWFLHMFPIRQVVDWERLRNGLVGAGAPVPRGLPVSC
jgi:DNA-binding SARP family transcriptional activator/TolB-like protein